MRSKICATHEGTHILVKFNRVYCSSNVIHYRVPIDSVETFLLGRRHVLSNVNRCSSSPAYLGHDWLTENVLLENGSQKVGLPQC